MNLGDLTASHLGEHITIGDKTGVLVKIEHEYDTGTAVGNYTAVVGEDMFGRWRACYVVDTPVRIGSEL